MDVNELTGRVIGCAIEVHRVLGPGLLESAYEQCLAYEMAEARIRCEVQKALPVAYKCIKLDCGYRIDMLVEGLLVVELKAVEQLMPIHEAQILTYMKLSGARIGLLINFNVPRLVDGVRRFVL